MAANAARNLKNNRRVENDDGSTRLREWGEKPEKKTAYVEPPKSTDAERKKYANDTRAFFNEFMSRSEGGKRLPLGRIHDYALDYAQLENQDHKRYTRMHEFCKPVYEKKDGRMTAHYPQVTWLYWPTIKNDIPQVAYGNDNHIADMFYDEAKVWRGLVMRKTGDATSNAVRFPRGHLKSTLFTKCLTLHTLVNKPNSTHMIFSATSDLADKFLKTIKSPFYNGAFLHLYGHYGPPDRGAGANWNNTEMQILRPDGNNITEASVCSLGAGSASTGKHVDYLWLDDIFTRDNYEKRRSVEELVADCSNILNKGGSIWDIGTPWESNDVHSWFTDKANDLSEDCSFIAATCIDADEENGTTKCSGMTGNIIFPEYFTEKKFRQKEAASRREGGSRFFLMQNFCQAKGSESRFFHQSWIRKYDKQPMDIARDLNLDIRIAADLASGKNFADRRDRTAIVCVGYDNTTGNYYLLDAAIEKMGVEHMPKVLFAMADMWSEHMISRSRHLICGVEENQYTTNAYATMFQRYNETGFTWSLQPLKHGGNNKPDRIRVLVPICERGNFHVADKMFKASATGGESYDVVERLLEEMSVYAGQDGVKDDALDAIAYAVSMIPAARKQPAAPKREMLNAGTTPGSSATAGGSLDGRNFGTPKPAQPAKPAGQPAKRVRTVFYS